MHCEKVRQALHAGEIKLVAPPLPDMDVAGVKLRLNTPQDAAANKCP
jgi:hypothetical protein